MFNRCKILKLRSVFLVGVTTWALIACGAQSTNAPASAPTPAPAPQQALPTLPAISLTPDSLAASVPVTAAKSLSPTLNPLEPYTDTVQNFVIGHPQGWARDATVTQGVKFVLGDHVETLTFANANGATANTFTKSEVVTEEAKGSANVKLLRSKSLPSAIIMTYDFTSITTPSYAGRGRRYYIPFADGRMAILTVTGRVAQFHNIVVQSIANSLKPAR